MRDDFYGSAWADNRHHVGATAGNGAHKLGRAIMVAFESLARQNYDAPWLVVRPSRTARHH